MCVFQFNTALLDGSPALTLVSSTLAHDLQLLAYDSRGVSTFKKYMSDHPNLRYAQ